MGAFFLHKNPQKTDLERVINSYRKKGFSEPHTFRLGKYKLQLYEKQLLHLRNYFRQDKLSVFAVGSLFYKGLGFQQSLKSLLSDFKNRRIDANSLYGNYVLIFFDESTEKTSFYTDPSFIKNVYFDEQNQCISTDFLALLAFRNGDYTLNIPAIVENLTTGHLISPDTYVNEIEKLDKVNIKELNQQFEGIGFNCLKPALADQVRSRAEAIDHANQLLTNYFKGVSAIGNEFGAHIGLTGGFDSRLLLMHARKQIKKLNVNSFWRPESKEYINARVLAKTAGLDFFSFEEKPFNVPGKEKMAEELMLVFDGQVRSQNRWDEEFALKDYTAAVANNHFVGFHGCGGEQYRNADRFSGKTSLRSFIFNEWMFKQCRNPFKDEKLKQEIFENIQRKLFRLIDDLGSRIGLFDLKRIQNEVWNTANRATRPNVLNQQQFYFAPFTEFIISHNAYNYIPFLGRSLSFQIDMMKKFDKELAAVTTNYGFNLIEGEPFKNRMISAVSGVIPRKLILQIYQKVKNISSPPPSALEFEGQMHPVLQDLNEPLDFKVLTHNVNLSSGVYAFNHLLNNI